MARSFTQRDLRNQSGKILRRLDQGESFIVIRNGAQAGELTPLRRHRFVTAEGVVSIFKDAPPLDPNRFRADLDVRAGQNITPDA